MCIESAVMKSRYGSAVERIAGSKSEGAESAGFRAGSGGSGEIRALMPGKIRRIGTSAER
jgi:hypothetical protein